MKAMELFVVPLDDVNRADVSRVGEKAATLGTLLSAGFPVPRGLCLTVHAFRMALAAFTAPIDVIIRRHSPFSVTSAQAAADEIRCLLDRLKLPPEIGAALRATLPDVTANATALAIRSSALGEDSRDVSFAGQYTSVLGVLGEAAVHTAILACWRSFFGANPLLARATHRENAASGGMGVLIQPLIQAECAGVCFSIDPAQQRRDRLVVNAAWGLGAGVVDGSVATDTARVRWADLSIEEHHVTVKQEQIIFDPVEGLRRFAVLPDRQRAACLPDAWLERVAQYGIAAQLLFEYPQDLEWAVAADRLWVLQSRPITGLPAELAQAYSFPVVWVSDDERRKLWRRYGRDDHDDVLLPLEQDELTQVESTREETCRLLGVERNQQIKIANGRIYARPIPVNWGSVDQRVRRAAFEGLQTRLQREGLTSWDHWGPEIVAATERLKAFDVDAADDRALADHMTEALAARRRHYMLHPACTIQPPASYFDAYAAVSGTSAAQALTSAYQLLDMGETPLSRRIELLYGLACTARQDAEVSTLIADRPSDVFARLAGIPQGCVFLEQLGRFMDEFGEHTGNGWGSEVLLRHPTWREHPETVLALLGPYLDPQVEPPAATRNRVQQSREARVETLCADCKDPAAVQEFRVQWAYARKVHAVLEVHNHYIDQVSTGQLRHAIMAAGRRLVSRCALGRAEDVLWLTFDEILDALRVDAPVSLTKLLVARQEQHATWSVMQSPPILGVPDAQLPERPTPGDDITVDPLDVPGVLTGQGASAGRCRGRARVIVDTETLPQLARGDILVVRNVGPAWLPLFPLLGGLILEGGSVGQHAAATAREYGIPAVVNLKRAVERIPDGAWVTVDGASGSVTFG